MITVCSRCGKSKPPDAFYMDRKRNRRRTVCAECDLAKNREYRLANRERIAARMAGWREENREEINNRARRRYAIHGRIQRNQGPAARERRSRELGGIYCLVCVPTGDTYYGSTSMLDTRKGLHMSSLATGNHDNPTMRRLSLAHSVEEFRFDILAYCSDSRMRAEMEQSLIRSLPCCNRKRTCDGSTSRRARAIATAMMEAMSDGDR